MADSADASVDAASEIEARLAAIVVSSGDAIISKDLDGIVRSWNAAAERIFGWTAEEMIGQPLLRIIPPERRDEEPAILARIRLGERVEPFATARLHKDGRRVFVSATVSPISDPSGRVIGASKIARDITRAAALEATYEAIVASADDAIISKSLDGIVLSWNRGAAQIFGYTAEEMIGQPLLRLFPPERVHEEADILMRIGRGEKVDHFETVRMHKSGRRIEISATISPIRSPTGEIIAASKIARDITAVKRLTEEREHLLVREQTARRDAERSNRAKDEFLATLSHELRTPLNSILGWAQMLQAGELAPEQLARGLTSIERNARAQAKLIDDLLDVSRIVSGKIELATGPIDLSMLLAERVESMRPFADEKDIVITTRLLDAPLGIMLGDRQRLEQVVANLLTNAIRYNRRGGRVELELRAQGHELELEVRDTGVGIEPNFLPALFERFTQADSSSTRRHGGLGLGLAIVRHLVELHGGRVSAHSAGTDRGATFLVRLPRGHQAPAERDALRISDQSSPFADLRGVTVLLVDDNIDALDMAACVLELAHARVARAASVDDGLRLFEHGGCDVLISDIAMPDRDGYEMLRAVRRRGYTGPAIALTAFGGTVDRQRMEDAGFRRVLVKPVDATLLVDAVDDVRPK